MPAFLSVLAFALMVAGIVGQYYAHSLFAHLLPWQIVQGLAVVLMIAARITFGRRSFHAAANPTAGGVVSSGPYHYWRHPIYAAAIYFTWAGALDHLSRWGYAWAAVLTVGAALRMMFEERLMQVRYPEYREYMARTKRVIPWVF